MWSYIIRLLMSKHIFTTYQISHNVLEKSLYHAYPNKDFKGGTELIVTMYF